jgi:hypothetical protein
MFMVVTTIEILWLWFLKPTTFESYLKTIQLYVSFFTYQGQLQVGNSIRCLQSRSSIVIHRLADYTAASVILGSSYAA